MALARNRRSDSATNYWPGFVDAMATLLLVIIFLLSIFMVTQFFLNQEISGKDTILLRLNSEIAELSELLALERTGKRSLEDSLAALNDSLSASQSRNETLQGLLESNNAEEGAAETRISGLTIELDEEKRTSTAALARVELLNQQIAALRRQLGSLEAALDATEQRDRDSQTRIADLGRRLNIALAQRVQELARYRSDFFGRLRSILSQRADIEIVGDRFVFQSEVLFESGSDVINQDGQGEMNKLAEALIELGGLIPEEIAWVIRVDGHTDARPIQSERFPSNWELSSARAIAVVRHLISRGVPAKRLVAAGFGEFQPIDQSGTEAAFRTNRRIELKLTER
ncbi:MAG: peptidoglycan -binding protein [Fimbriimonadaceae bacterium]|nr:peptidoglycan -binding protein [Alphaproteobacteria bacterium]